MKFNIRRWSESLFTRQERLALVFVLGVGFAGILIQQCRFAAHAQVQTANAPQLQVRINSAAPEELAALPGIGPVMARRIAEDRKKHGSFLIFDDLRRVKGMTAKTAAKLKTLVRFD